MTDALAPAAQHDAATARGLARRVRLWAEFGVLFIGVPVVAALGLEPREIIGGVLPAMTVVGLALIALTPGFRWRSLFEGGVGRHAGFVALFVVGTAALVTAVVLWLRPWMFLSFPLERTELWLMVMLLYPILSVLPQELLYRTLYFERYGALFGESDRARWVAIGLNGVLFGVAHLFYMNWPAILLTTLAGFFFAYAYAERRSFPLACVLHALGGQLVFTSGLGIYFYHGAAG